MPYPVVERFAPRRHAPPAQRFTQRAPALLPRNATSGRDVRQRGRQAAYNAQRASSLPPTVSASAVRMASGAFMMFMKLFAPIMDRSGKEMAMRKRAYSA